MKSLKIKVILFIVNHFLCGTRFFKIKKFLLCLCGVKIGEGTKIVGPLYFGTMLKLEIGKDCWIGKEFHLDGCGSVVIGNCVDIAPHVVINTGGHEIGYQCRRAGKGKNVNIKIGDGTWIGTRTTIINNTHINNGVVVAAGSLVIDDVIPNVMVAGVPCIIKKALS